jgi:hypothetical protein
MAAAVPNGRTTCRMVAPVRDQNARKDATTAHALLRICASAKMVGRGQLVQYLSALLHVRMELAWDLTNVAVGLGGREPPVI